MTSPPPVHVRAPGKINLSLRAGPPDTEGYHPLATVFQAVSLYEDVVAHPGQGVSVQINGRGADLPTDTTNLAVRAAGLLRSSTGTEDGVRLELTKAVPVAGGMAGGSADAAATLLACDQLWGTGRTREELVALAARLGADVPFALTGMTAVGTGRGDVVTPAMSRGTYHWVLALQDEGLSTPEVFRALDEGAGPGRPQPEVDEDLLAALVGGDATALAPHLGNDLQEPALDLRPELGDVLAACHRAGALAALVSGSGPTVVALALDGPHARSVAEVVRAAEVADEVLTATGPVPGARVVERVGAQ
ncbi:4-(cytidine 5'-diphospho)-2-C-methyl-D-erythritol kinase [Georgenia sp. 10Sc9-8]|uniref:4-diphosphocytidyl-2-C-methyl-D-erythritol kinase n=1 Tax=Georgenia halotolerans TaxID=3028317 RepID=A0ABT5TZX9_9MICO|nr:4-(cytidine 5'-diphospho)-2-C-methyl-D-erythritol kinase [Georgenia halotolerans]